MDTLYETDLDVIESHLVILLLLLDSIIGVTIGFITCTSLIPSVPPKLPSALINFVIEALGLHVTV